MAGRTEKVVRRRLATEHGLVVLFQYPATDRYAFFHPGGKVRFLFPLLSALSRSRVARDLPSHVS